MAKTDFPAGRLEHIEFLQDIRGNGYIAGISDEKALNIPAGMWNLAKLQWKQQGENCLRRQEFRMQH